jgi:hypothetical protein
MSNYGWSQYTLDEGPQDSATVDATLVKRGSTNTRIYVIDLKKAKGVELEFKESIAPALGMSYGGKIAILPGQSAAEEFSTLVHEASHKLLHKCSRRTATTKTVHETEAEAIAFVVSQTIGLDARRAADDDIHLYNGNAALLTESLEVIQRASALILSARKSCRFRPKRSYPSSSPRMTPPMQPSRRWCNGEACFAILNRLVRSLHSGIQNQS